MKKIVIICVLCIAVCEARASLSCADCGEYIEIDISGGQSAPSYPIRPVDAGLSPNWSKKYKTDFLLLRRVGPGKFQMTGSSPTNRHEVVLTKPYYIGVFEVTQRQYELVMGRSPAADQVPDKAVDNVSWDDIRGTNSEDIAARSKYEWPVSREVAADSFVGRLRAKTFCVGIDLPTEAQWAYACGYGMSENALGVDENGVEVFDKARTGNLGEKVAVERVGMHLPNKLGIYDMHGNVYEWCLDKFGESWRAIEIDPVGPNCYGNSEDFHVLRGGTYASSGRWCRMKYVREIGWDRFGFRIALTIIETK
jgi:formylglycine-generating enzyme required for sulfatase activity